MAGQGISGDHKDESIDSDDYVDGSVDTVHLADDAVTLAKMASGTDGNIISYDASGNPVAIATGNDGQVLTSAGSGAAPAFEDAAALGANSVDSASYVDGSIDPEHLADNAVTLAKMASGTDGNIISYDASGNPVAIATGDSGQILTSAGVGAPPTFAAPAALGANSVDSDNYVDGSIDTDHLAADAVTYVKMQNLGTANRVLGATSTGVIGETQVVAAMMAANSVDSASYVDGSIDPEHLADNAVTLAKMASGTDGNIISFDASGNPVAIATGNDGQILTSAGTGAPPAFEDAAALGANSIDSDNYVDGSIDPEHLADNAVTLAKMASGTDGNIISYDASGNPVAIATGTDGQVLTSAGAGAQPAFEDAGGGGAMVMIGTSVASDSSSLTITGLDSTYDSYFMALSDIKGAAGIPRFRFGDSSGIDSGSGDYSWHQSNAKYNSAAYGGGDVSSDTSISLCYFVLETGTGDGFTASVWLNRPADGTTMPNVNWLYQNLSVGDAGLSRGGPGFGRRSAVITMDRIQFYLSTGNIESGRFTVWGISHA